MKLPLGELAEEIVGEKVRLDALALQEDELSDTRAVFSWSYRAMTPELQQAFRRLGLHSGSDISLGAAAAIIGVETSAARRQLRSLAQVHLIEEAAANRFHMHDLLRSYACERAAAEDSQQERIQAIRRVLTWYLLASDAGRRAILPYSAAVPLVPARGVDVRKGFGDSIEAMRWFDSEHLNILAALTKAAEHGQLDIVWKLAVTVSGFLELRSHWPDWEHSIRAALAAAQTLGDPFGEAVSLQLMADVSWRNGHLAEARDQYGRSSVLAREISVGWLEGFALRGLGLVQEEQGDAEAARCLFEKALHVFRKSSHRRGEGMSLLSLGKTARALTNVSDAISYGSQALGLFEEIGESGTSHGENSHWLPASPTSAVMRKRNAGSTRRWMLSETSATRAARP